MIKSIQAALYKSIFVVQPAKSCPNFTLFIEQNTVRLKLTL